MCVRHARCDTYREAVTFRKSREISLNFRNNDPRHVWGDNPHDCLLLVPVQFFASSEGLPCRFVVELHTYSTVREKENRRL